MIGCLLVSSCSKYATNSDVKVKMYSLAVDFETDILTLDSKIQYLNSKIDSLHSMKIYEFVVVEGEEDLEIIAEQIYGDSLRSELLEALNRAKLEDGLQAGEVLIYIK